MSIQKYLELHQQIADLQKLMQEVAHDAFKEWARKLFTDFPDMDSFGWHQYTPYFNDGDPCIFRVDTDPYNIDINGEDNYYTTPKSEPMYTAVSEFLGYFDSDFLEQLFGDHVSITVYRDGVTETEEYNHD